MTGVADVMRDGAVIGTVKYYVQIDVRDRVTGRIVDAEWPGPPKAQVSMAFLPLGPESSKLTIVTEDGTHVEFLVRSTTGVIINGRVVRHERS